MDILNFVMLGLIIGVALWSIWWAFNTFRQIEAQKDFSAPTLISIAKLWRRAKFVPEDAKERESLYLYRDFLRKFEDSDCKYPIMVKNGGVRAMSRKEYDSVCGQQEIRPFSILILALSVIVSLGTLVGNIISGKNIVLGIAMSLILPGLQILLALVMMRMNKEKNTYRDAIFLAIKENSVAFLSITKPFVIVDAYPEKFGKNAQPLYTVRGEISDEQIAETRDYIIRQKEAETKVVLRNVNAMPEPTPIPADEEEIEIDLKKAKKEAKKQAKLDKDDPNRPLTLKEKENLINNLIDDALYAEVNRAVKKAEQAAEKPVELEDLQPLPVVVENAPETPVDVEAPAEDDFSLDAIGLALDAEIAKRNKKKS